MTRKRTSAVWSIIAAARRICDKTFRVFVAEETAERRENRIERLQVRERIYSKAKLGSG